MKLAVEVAKILAECNEERCLGKRVKRVRKGEQTRNEMVKDANQQILRDSYGVRKK